MGSWWRQPGLAWRASSSQNRRLWQSSNLPKTRKSAGPGSSARKPRVCEHSKAATDGLPARSGPATNPRTADQQGHRHNVRAVSARWHTLTPDQEAAWRALAANTYFITDTGSRVRRNCYNWFVSLNTRRADLGLPQFDVPPAEPVFPDQPGEGVGRYLHGRQVHPLGPRRRHAGAVDPGARRQAGQQLASGACSTSPSWGCCRPQ